MTTDQILARLTIRAERRAILAREACDPTLAEVLALIASSDLRLIRCGDIGEEQETIESEPIEVPVETPAREPVPA